MIGIEPVKVDAHMSASFSSCPYWNLILRLSTLLIIVALPLISGCTVTTRTMPPMARLEGVKRPFFAGQILDLKRKNTIFYRELVEKLSSSDIVFLGEVHDNPDHHLIQIQLLQSLSDKWGKFALGVEFIPANKQPPLDEYIQGKASEEEFLKKVNWHDTWGYDYHFYRALLEHQRIMGGSVIAINAPHELVKKVSRAGLGSLNPEERASLPQTIDLTDKVHRAYLKKIYQSHPHGNLKNFEYFYEAQCVWEETMAENIAKYYSRYKGKIIVICGNGHIIHGFGIPKRLRRRIKARVMTLMPYPLTERTSIEKDMADFVWLTGKYFRIPKHHPGKIKGHHKQNGFDKKPRKN